MQVIKRVTGVPKGRSEITALQSDFRGAMMDRGVYSQADAARLLRISPATLSQHLRGRRRNPMVLKKILEIMQRKNGGRRSAA